jgi:hypothetical protein
LLLSSETGGGARIWTAGARLKNLADLRAGGIGVFGVAQLCGAVQCLEVGGPCWIRTSDQLVKSQLLYQLS